MTVTAQKQEQNVQRVEQIDPDRVSEWKDAREEVERLATPSAAAAQHALIDAGLEPGGYDPQRTGVTYSSDYMLTLPEEFIEVANDKMAAINAAYDSIEKERGWK